MNYNVQLKIVQGLEHYQKQLQNYSVIIFLIHFPKKRILDSLLNLERYNIAIRAELMIYILDYTGEWLWYTLTRLNYYFIINKMEQLEVYLDTLPPESLKKWKEHIQIMKQK